MDTLLKDRLQALIDILFGGNVANASRVSGVALHRIVEGKVDPRLATLNRLAEAFAVPTTYFLTNTSTSLIPDKDIPDWYFLMRNYFKKEQTDFRKELGRLASTNWLEDSNLISILRNSSTREQAGLQDLVRNIGEAETDLLKRTVAQIHRKNI